LIKLVGIDKVPKISRSARESESSEVLSARRTGEPDLSASPFFEWQDFFP
jgi:hypothetical protein